VWREQARGAKRRRERVGRAEHGRGGHFGGGEAERHSLPTEPGEPREAGGARIGAGDDRLVVIREVQFPSRKRMAALEASHSRLKPGVVLTTPKEPDGADRA